jgi:hypothetical protein
MAATGAAATGAAETGAAETGAAEAGADGAPEDGAPEADGAGAAEAGPVGAPEADGAGGAGGADGEPGEPEATGRLLLAVDTRERALFPTIARAGWPFRHEIRQLTTGDFAVCCGDAVLACVERKTLPDFGASIRDGRYAGERDNMLRLRAATGCRLLWIVEGPAFPAPTTRFARIPYASIASAMLSLTVRDGIHVLQTRDASGTVARLGDLVRALVRCDLVPRQVPGAGVPRPVPGAGVPRQVPGTLTARREQTPARAAHAAWCTLPGVSVATADALAGTIRLGDALARAVDPARLGAVRTAAGARLSARALAAVAAPSAARVLAAVSGVTAAAAAALVAAAGAAGLAAMPAAAMADIALGSRRLGPARAARVRAMLDH